MVVRNGGLRLLGGFAIGLMRVRWAWGLDLFVLEQWVIGLFFVGPMALHGRRVCAMDVKG